MPTKIQAYDMADRAITPSKLAVPNAKGDLLGFDTAPNRVAVGTDGQILVADSTQELGVKWDTSSNRLLVANTNITGNIVSGTSETNFSSNFSIAANTLCVGQVISISAKGILTTTIVPTITFKVKYGNVVLGTVSKNLGPLGNNGWNLNFDIVVWNLGTSGTIDAQGMLFIPDAIIMSNDSVVTINTTTTNLLQISAQWSKSGNIAIMRQFIVRTSH